MDPVVRPSTVTWARETRWSTARMIPVCNEMEGTGMRKDSIVAVERKKPRHRKQAKKSQRDLDRVQASRKSLPR